MTLACCYEDDGGFSLPTEHRKARKQHKCIACRKPICRGHEYHITKYIFDGTIDVEKWCDNCYEMANALWNLGFCFEYDDLWGSYQEYLIDYVPKLPIEENEDRYFDEMILHNGRTVEQQVEHVKNLRS